MTDSTISADNTGSADSTAATEHWAARLAELSARHSVPGANLGILHRGRLIVETATGWANSGAGIEETTEFILKICSISNVLYKCFSMW
ncbi:hypothetical protein ACWHIR_02690, partial [Streptomyces celluloflavus]